MDYKLLRKPLTKEGHTRLAEEHDRLSRKERPQVVAGIATAAAEGDRSENAEYIYGRKRLREMDKRITYLNKLLTDAQIIDPTRVPKGRVSFGSTVRIQEVDEEGEAKEKTWTLVGEGEADYARGGISWKSPIGKALLGHKAGDVVRVKIPKGEVELEILEC